MSEHQHVDESGRNRFFLSVFVVALGVCLAVWQGYARPHVRDRAQAGPHGVVVLDDAAGTVLRGTVLVRGPSLVVLQGQHEFVLPRASVRYFDAESDQLSAAYYEKYADAPLADETPARRPTGTAVLVDGRVLVGFMEVAEDHLLVGDEVLPRERVRWFAVGVEGPTQDYWDRFPRAPIDPAYRPR